MQLRADDLAVHVFTPSDGSESAAIKVVHRPSGKESINDATECQIKNLRLAITTLLTAMNPHPEQIYPPEMILFDHVRVNLPESFHDGDIKDMSWDYTSSEWRFFVECTETKVTNWYVVADLEPIEEA